MTEKTVAVRKQKEVTNETSSVETFISQAIAANVPVETMEKLFALREKVRAEQAKEAFVTALANFQSQCPVIEKSKKVMNKDGRTVRYQYAPLEVIVEQIKRPLSDNKLSYTWDVRNDEGFITAICTVTHALGFSQTSEFKVPIDKEGFMTAPQKYASALTFAKRYSFCNALGISTGDEDTDATDVNKEPNAKSDRSKVIFCLRTLGRPTKTKEEVAKSVKDLTGLELADGNLSEIVARLEVAVQQKHEDKDVQ